MVFDNLQIEQNDGLPQAVCINCLGTLEFLCDFLDRCHRTQKELESKKPPVVFAEGHLMDDSDVESDKENTPPPRGRPRKIKTLTVNKLKPTKSSLRQISIKDMLVKKVNRTEATTKDAEKIETREIMAKSMPNRVRRIRRQTEYLGVSNVPKKKKHVKANNDDGETKGLARTTRSSTTNGTTSLSRSDADSKNLDAMNLELPLKRKTCGRKSMLEKMLDLNHSLNAMMKRDGSQRSLSSETTEEHASPTKRRRLRSSTSSTDRNSKEQTKTMKESTTVTDTAEKTESNDKVLPKLVDAGKSSLPEKAKESTTEKPLAVTIKQEKIDNSDILPVSSPRSASSSSFVWIPKDSILEASKPQSQPRVTNGITTSPPPGDVAENTKINKNNATTVLENTKPLQGSTCDIQSGIGTATSVRPKRTIIKSTESADITIPKIQDEDCKEVEEITNSMRTRNDSPGSSITSDRSYSEEINQNDSFKDRKTGSTVFGKVSDLINEEDKHVIESYYMVHMSRVNTEEVQKHLALVGKNIKCNICGRLYGRVDKCQIHIWAHLNMKPYQCKVCDFSTVTVSNVRGHIRKKHLKLKPFACQLCERRYITAALLEEHLNTHTGNRPFKCKLCNFSCANRPLLRYHAAKHKAVKDVLCKVCGKAFYTRDRLRGHEITHKKDKVFMCKLCSSYLSSTEALELHYKKVHMRDYVCDICGKHAKSRKALYNHRNVHTAAKFQCTLCPNVYKSSQILKEHLLKHEGIRKYKCTVCEKSFAQQSHLAAHMAVHSNVRFHCPGCDKGFNRHDNMKIHTKRCKDFLAKPELKNVILKRERSLSGSNKAPYVKILEDNNSLKDVKENNKTDPDESVEEVQKLPEISEDDITDQNSGENHIHNTSDDDVVILENVLRVENF